MARTGINPGPHKAAHVAHHCSCYIMLTRNLLTILLVILYFSSFGQSSKLILTGEENEKWLDSLNSLQLVQQLSMMKNRLLLDTNVFVRESYPDGIKVNDSLGGRVYGVAKPLILVNGTPLVIKNDANRKEILRLVDLICAKNIKTVIAIKANPKDQAIYGRNAMNGSIFLELNRKRVLRKFKRLDLGLLYVIPGIRILSLVVLSNCVRIVD